MTTSGKSDALVVGAGPAGTAAAITLARAGLRVTLVDRAAFPRPKICGDAFSNNALAVAEQLAGSAAVAAVPRATVAGAVAIFPDGSRVRRSYGSAPGAIVTRDDFDGMLVRAALDAGVNLVSGTTVRALVREGARIVGAHGTDFDWRADVTVAADGTASVAWDALGLSPPAPSSLGISATTYFEGLPESADPGFSEHYFEKSLPTGYGWVFPPVEGRANVGVYLRVDRYRGRGVTIKTLLSEFIARQSARFGRARAVGAARTWSLPLATFVPPLAAPGLLIAGDAARLIDPLTGEGIWHALASGKLAGEAAAEAVRGTRSDESLMARYRSAVLRDVAWPTAVRRVLERMTTLVVKADLYRSPAVRRLLEWGYNRRSLEVAKRVVA